MMIRGIFREWLPPRLQDWVRARCCGSKWVATWPDVVSGGWPAAAEQAAKGHAEEVRRMSESAAIGYLPEEEPTAWWCGGDPQYHHRMVQFALVAARAAAERGAPLRILDYGGLLGAHARGLKRILPAMSCDYTVCELPAFCEQARQLNPDVR